MFRRSLLAIAAALALTGAAAANDADLCGEDSTEPSLRAEACTRLIRTGKYRGNNLAAVHNNRGIAYRELNDFARAHSDYSEAVRLNPLYEKAFYNRALLWTARNGGQARA